MEEPIRCSDEAVAKVLKGLRERLLASAKPRPKPRVEAEVLDFPPKLSEQELLRRQRVIDQTWAGVVAERRALDAEAARTCHRGPGDPDWAA
jgi:hypothetical protein